MLRASLLLGIMVVSTVMVTVVIIVPKAEAAPVLQQSVNVVTHNTTTVTATFGTAATANRLLIAVCAASSTAITGPTGFSTAINQTGTPSQGIFYKVAAGGETSVSCTSGSSFMGINVFEYSGMVTTSVLNGTPGSATGTSTSTSSGSTTTTTAETLLIAGMTIGGETSFSAWTNSFTEQYDVAIGAGQPGSRQTFAGASRSVIATGTYSTAATAAASGAWRGQIAAFETSLGALGVDIVNSAGNTVASPSVGMSALTQGFDCQTSTGTLGVSEERIRISNTTSTPQWTVAIAATSGATSTWSSGGDTFDFNDGSGTPAGCADGGDADGVAGQLTLNASAGTSSPQAGCTNTGVSLGSSSSFSQGVTDSITLITASSGADTDCYWDLTGVSASQTIPVQQATGTYTINLTLTVTAT